MKIGITERGDAGIDLSWKDRLNEVDGAILITKDVTSFNFQKAVKQCRKPLILHCTCTGMGGTTFEPFVPHHRTQLKTLKRMIDDKVIPPERVVIRIDPIYPMDLFYLKTVLKTINEVFTEDEVNVMRYRISVMDFYPHVKERFKENHLPTPKGFTATAEQFKEISDVLGQYPWMTFETCAEKDLNSRNVIHTGCVSREDIALMGLDPGQTPETRNGQNRHGCLCLTCKSELLTNKYRCPHRCLYCYWRDK